MSKKLIWDLPIRIVHWLLTVLIFGSWYTVTVSGDMERHMLIGQTILCLLVFRVVWGFVGTRYAKFSSFVFGPRTIVAYARSILSRSGGGYAGHNPLGFLAVFAMLLLIGIQVSTGLFATDGDFYEGPLNHLVSGRTGNRITDIHYLNFRRAGDHDRHSHRRDILLPVLQARKPDLAHVHRQEDRRRASGHQWIEAGPGNWSNRGERGRGFPAGYAALAA